MLSRKPDERIEQAKKMYLNGAKSVEIASQLNRPEGTVRRWKSTYKWENERSDKNNERSIRKKSDKETAAEDVGQVMNNPGLTDKQRLFCLYYIRCFNATKAYQKAYGCDYFSAKAHGYELLRKVAVRDEIQQLKQNRLNREMLNEYDIFQKYMDIAFADITDYVEFGREEVQVMGAFGPIEAVDSVTGKRVPLKKTINTVRFKESGEIDGTLISEIKQGKDGASIKLLDRMKALSWLADHMNLATEEQKAHIDMMRARVMQNGVAGGGNENQEIRIYIPEKEKDDDA